MNLFFQKRFPEENMTINLFSFFVKIGDIVVKIQRVGSCFICVGKTFWDSVSFTQNLLIFFWVGFRWDGLQGPEMGGMDPSQTPTKGFVWHIMTSVPKWKVKNHLIFILKDSYRFFHLEERESFTAIASTSGAVPVPVVLSAKTQRLQTILEIDSVNCGVKSLCWGVHSIVHLNVQIQNMERIHFQKKMHCITLCKWSWLTLVTSLLFAFYGF